MRRNLAYLLVDGATSVDAPEQLVEPRVPQLGQIGQLPAGRETVISTTASLRGNKADGKRYDGRTWKPTARALSKTASMSAAGAERRSSERRYVVHSATTHGQLRTARACTYRGPVKEWVSHCGRRNLHTHTWRRVVWRRRSER